jgi:hypothetical protein
MLMYMYTVRDSAGQLFGRPFYCHNVGHAVRGFTDQVNDPMDGQNDLFKHTADFELYELGTFDDNTALIETHPQPKAICTGLSVKKPSGSNVT